MSSPAPIAAPLRALLVEDNPADARLFKELLREAPSLPVELSTVGTLSQALAVVGDRAPDVVLLDLSLPDGSGLGNVRRMQQTAPEIALVVLTGLDDESVAVQAMAEGAQDYLVKGQVDGQLLARALRWAVERKRAEAAAMRLARESAAREEAEAQARRLRFLVEASQVLASSLDLQMTLDAVVQLAATHTGDDCLLEIVQPTGRLRFAAVGSPLVSVARRWAAIDPPSPTPPRGVDSPQLRVTAGIRPFPAASVGPAELQLWAETRPEATLVVPLVARGQVVGSLTFLRLDGRPPQGAEERALGEELAGRIALAVDNARLYSEAQEATRARDEVLAVVSHDLRNPLSVVMMTAATLRRASAGLDEKRLAQLAKLESAAQRMAKLIENLLDVVRIEARALTLSPDRHDVRQLVGEAAEMLRPLAEQKSLRLELMLDEAPPSVRADKERVLQVFSNLVGNAIKFTPAGGRITLGARLEEGEAHLWVQDDGPGIEPSHLPRLFDRFFQARRADRRGAGLGLAIVKGLIEAHGGRVWVDSRLGEGTTFRFTLPAA